MTDRSFPGPRPREEVDFRSLSLRWRAGIAVFLVVALSWLGRRFLMDDPFIYFRYMRNALNGAGLVFNPGEHVNAMTSPLYTYVLLAASSLLGGHIYLAGWLIFTASLAGAAVLAERLFPFAGLLLASTVYFYTLIGMETALVLFLLMLSLTLLLEERTRWLPLVLVLLALARLEAGALIPVAFVYLLRKKKLPGWRACLPAVAALLLLALMNHHFYGQLLPSSSTAKIEQGRSGYWGAWPTAFLRVRGFLFTPPGSVYSILLIFALGCAGIYRMRGSRFNRLALPFAGILLCFYIGFNLPSYHWYYAPFVFLLVLYAAVALRGFRYGSVAASLLVAVQSVAAAAMLHAPQPWMESYQSISAWLSGNATPGASVAACEIGVVGWDTRLRVLDILGLTEPKNAAHIAHRDVSSWLAEDKPDYIVMHTPAWSWEAAALGNPDYVRLPVQSGNVYLLGRRAAASAPLSSPPAH